MGYSTLNDVQFWGQFSNSDFGSDAGDYDYINSVQRLIDFADGEIDSYIRVPKGFFNSVVVDNEYHDGKRVPSGNKPLLRPNYIPILSVVKLGYWENGSWVTKTEGNSSDYIVLEHGIRLVTLPDRTDYKNIRLTYKCGYVQTPAIIVTVSGRLAAAVGQLIIDANKREPATLSNLNVGVPELASLTKVAFTPELKDLLSEYRLRQVRVYVK